MAHADHAILASTSDERLMTTSRAALNRKAAQLAQRLGFTLSKPEPDDSRTSSMYRVKRNDPWALTWWMRDAEGESAGRIRLEIQSGYTVAGDGWKGDAMIVSHVPLTGDADFDFQNRWNSHTYASEAFVRPWDSLTIPKTARGATVGKETREKFAAWNPTMTPKPDPVTDAQP